MDNPLIVIVGRTASGKDTLANKIKNENRTMAKSYTTRPRREGEGNTHIFIESIDGYNDRILETTINNHHYFLTGDDLTNHDILVIDPAGVKELIETYNNRPFKIVYLDIDRKIRQKRYIKRDTATLTDFINRDISENSQFSQFESFIKHDNIKNEYDIVILKDNEDINKLINSLNERR